jgi:putative phosphoribosyl transferase
MFADRRDAGRRLAALVRERRPHDPVVVGLPRGGMVVASAVAAALGAPLDVLCVRKLGCPWQPELGIGALAEGSVRVVNERLVQELGIGAALLEEVTARETEELARRVRAYRGDRPPCDVSGRTAVVVDDGLATGYTARAAILAVRERGAARTMLAVPVAPADEVEAMAAAVDDVVVVDVEPWFFAIGDAYEDFSQTSDEEVVALLATLG